MKYALVMKFKTGDLYSGVREVENSVNEFMANCGFHEKMFCQSEAPIMTMEVDKDLTSEEMETVRAALNKILAEQDKFKMECTRMERIE